MTGTLAIAGGTGALGRCVAARALAAGWRVRLATRAPARLPAALAGQVDVVVGDLREPGHARALVRDVDAVFSCAGGSVAVGLGHGWRGFGAVDPRLNLGLIAAARAAGRPRFVYVSVFHTPAMRRLAYVEAHERVVDALADADLPWAALRPTGFHSAIVPLYLGFARRGRAPEIGDGRVRTNPIADDDLAALCLDALAAPAGVVEVGGPEVVERRQLVELAAAALGRRVEVQRVPASLARAGSGLARLFHPRLGQLGAFVTALATQDLVAPARGTLRLADAFAAAARA